ncbi:MAG: methyltransferase domain-containing protein [Syntrophobacteraceae bacterium]
MKYRLMDVLRCHCGKTALSLENPTVEKVRFDHSLDEIKCRYVCGKKDKAVGEADLTPADCAECYAMEIKAGQLACECGEKYPIVKGIPRFIPAILREDLQKIQKTFSYEWKMFRFGDRNWGQDIEFRKSLFLQGMQASAGDLAGKLILDAGCGSGLLSMEMANSFKMEVVALDLAFGIEQAYAHNTNPFVHFIQGSVLDLPFRSRYFDLLYCAGVLVALPDTRLGFLSIIEVLKKGGRCFIWVYHPIDRTYHPYDRRKMAMYNWIRINVTSKLPIKWQYYIFLSFIPGFLLKQQIEYLSGNRPDKLKVREKLQSLFDFYSPVYQNRHTFEEVVGWFEKEGFNDIKISDVGSCGFGVKGDLANL